MKIPINVIKDQVTKSRAKEKNTEDKKTIERDAFVAKKSRKLGAKDAIESKRG